jgi:hypothetical protein
MDDGLLARRAQSSHAAAVEALYRQLVGSPAVQVLPRRLAEQADDPTTWLLVAQRAHQVGGTLNPHPPKNRLPRWRGIGSIALSTRR